MLMSRLQTGIRENRVYKLKMKRLSGAIGLDFHSFSSRSFWTPRHFLQLKMLLDFFKKLNRSSLNLSPSFLIIRICYALSVIKLVILVYNKKLIKPALLSTIRLLFKESRIILTRQSRCYQPSL